MSLKWTGVVPVTTVSAGFKKIRISSKRIDDPKRIQGVKGSRVQVKRKSKEVMSRCADKIAGQETERNGHTAQGKEKSV